MKHLRTTTILAVALLSLTVISCKDGKKEQKSEESHTEMKHDNSDGHHDNEKKEAIMSSNQDGNTEAVLKDYFNLKDVLVNDDEAKAKELGATLAKSLVSLDFSTYTETQKTELKDIIKDALEHAESILLKVL
jgi:hypothetical protein